MNVQCTSKAGKQGGNVHSRLIKMIAGKHLSYKKVFPTVVKYQLGINDL